MRPRTYTVVAPDSFKGTHDAPAVAAAIATGLEEAGVEARSMPVADGGEGTLDVLSAALRLEIATVGSYNAWKQPIQARIGLNPTGTAVVEVAETCGLHAPHDGVRDPVTASTYGVGHQVATAIELGARHVVIATGGSATTDGGGGAVEALREACGAGRMRLSVLSDVRTTYLRAAEVFGPQKGANAADVALLSRRLEQARRTMPRDPEQVVGSGAAGGLAGALWSHFGAKVVSGADFVLDALGFDEAAAEADAVITGEGRLDAQTAEGKIVARVTARSGSTPVHVVAGSLEPAGVDAERFAGVQVASTLDQLRVAGRVLGHDLTAANALPASE